MSWNYRVIKVRDEDGEPWFAVHEVYYDEGRPTSWTVEPVTVEGEHIFALSQDLAWMLKALTLPVLEIAGDKLIECNAVTVGESL